MFWDALTSSRWLTGGNQVAQVTSMFGGGAIKRL